VTRLTNDDYVYRNASYSRRKYLSFVRDPGTDMIIREKRDHAGYICTRGRPGGEAIT